jgi:hypothetical protein
VGGTWKPLEGGMSRRKPLEDVEVGGTWSGLWGCLAEAIALEVPVLLAPHLRHHVRPSLACFLGLAMLIRCRPSNHIAHMLLRFGHAH